MAKIERGRISGLDGMESHSAMTLYAWADRMEAQIKDPLNRDDPRWLQRWADKMRRLASKKELNVTHKCGIQRRP